MAVETTASKLWEELGKLTQEMWEAEFEQKLKEFGMIVDP